MEHLSNDNVAVLILASVSGLDFLRRAFVWLIAKELLRKAPIHREGLGAHKRDVYDHRSSPASFATARKVSKSTLPSRSA